MTAPDADRARPLRILMVAATPYFADRGCHVRIQGEARALERAGVRVDILTYGLGRDVEGGRIVRAPGLPGFQRLDAAPSLGKLPADLLLLLAALREGRRACFDVIHAHTQEGGALGIVLGRVMGLPVLVDLQSRRVAEELEHYGHSREGGLLYHLADTFDRWIPAAAGGVVASTGAIAEYAREIARAPGPVEVLGDAIDVPSEPPAREPELARRLGLDPQRPIVAYVGLLTETQGIDLLIEAAAELRDLRPDVQWLVMGYPGEPDWRARARSAGLGEVMVFTGQMPFDQAPRHLALATLAVSPKRSSTEGNGKLLLYMSLGLPALALDTATNREVLGEDGGYFADDARAFAGAISTALADPAGLARRGERLRERARREGSWDARARQLIRLYRQLAA